MKLISKIASLSVGLALAVGVGVTIGSKEAKVVKADDVTITPSQFTEATQTEIEQTVGEFTFSISSQGTITSDQVRVFKSSTLTISISSGSITEIEMTCTASGTAKYGPGCFAAQDGYSYDGTVGTWTGDAASVSFTASSNQVRVTQFVITYGGSKTITSITLAKDDASVKKSYYAGESASTAGLTVTAHYDDSSSADVTSSATITANPSTVALSTTSITYSATLGEKTSNSVTVNGITVTRENLVAKAYEIAVDTANVNVTGKYMGSVNDGYYIMNGAYGFFIYKGTLPTGAVEGESLLTVTGTKAYFRGLHQLKDSSASIDSTLDIDPVQLYSLNGSETYEDEILESRRTHINGVVTSIVFNSVEYTKTITSEEEEAILATVGDSKTGKDITVNIDDSTIVFFKKGDQTTDLVTTLISNLRGETNMTVAAFTSVYNHETTQQFQLRFLKFVEAKEDYTAEEFAQDLLDQTDAVCAGWKEGDNNHDALVTIWTDLNSEEKYQALPQAQRDILAEADRDESGTVVEQAMARYDFLTGKYDLDNFITGRTPIVPASGRYGDISSITSDNTMIIVITIASVSALAFTMLLVFKKKKQK